MKSKVREGRVLDAGGRIIAVKTSAAPRFTLVIACVWTFKFNAFAIFTLMARPVLWPPVTTSGNGAPAIIDRKSTRLNSSHSQISYAVFCLKKKKKKPEI